MKRSSLLLAILIGLLVYFLAVALLFTCFPVEVRYAVRSEQPFSLEFFFSEPMGRDADRETPFGQPPSTPTETGPETITHAFRVPLSRFRITEMHPSENADFELEFLQVSVFGGLLSETHTPQHMHRSGRPNGQLTTFLDPERGTLRVRTSGPQGLWRFRIANDFPRILPFLLALIPALLAAVLTVLGADKTFRGRFASSLKHRHVLLIVLFVLLLYGPGLAYAIFPTRDATGRAPEFKLRTMQNYPEEFSGWYRHSLPYRTEIFALYHRLTTATGIPAMRDVIQGNEGWLFSNIQDKRTGEYMYADYMGTNLYSEEQLRTILNNLERIRDRLAEKNIRFVVFLAPNKLEIYGDRFLPESFKRKNPAVLTRSQQVYDYVKTHSRLPIAYPADEIRAASEKTSHPIYLQTDTHWNHLGAYVGTRELWRLIDPPVAEKFQDISKLDVTIEKMYRGDLYNIMEMPMDMREPMYRPVTPFFGDAPTLDQDTFGYRELPASGSKGPRLFVIRDSFIFGMLPYLTPHAEQVALYWNYDYNETMIQRFRTDVVVLETVGRLLDRFLNLPDCNEDRGAIQINGGN